MPQPTQTVIPRLAVYDPRGLVRFLRDAFDAGGDYVPDAPSMMRIGNSTIMVGGAEAREARYGFLYVYVESADLTYRLALDAGATSLEHPQDTPYGDRRAMIRDPFGNVWQIATPLG